MNQASDSPAQRADPTCEYVVGIGASAGGVEALKALLRGLPVGAGAAYVVVPHLMPDFDSRLVPLLAKESEFPVAAAEDGAKVQRDTVLVLPPGKQMILSGDELLVSALEGGEGDTHPIDQFFRSLATGRRRFAVAIVLSGAGDDGSRGLVEVHAEGGLVMAQSTGTAEFVGMPKSAIETGLVDVVLPPEEMGHALRTYVEEALTPDALSSQQFGGPALESLVPLIEALEEAHGIDFSSYKPATLLRRLERRRLAEGFESLEAWIESVTSDPSALEPILNDLLIGVTSFRRDEEAFRLLEREVLPEFLSSDSSSQPIRVWVAGCSTGEETYSVLIAIEELLRRRGEEREVRVFATDVNPRALAHASHGEYAEAALDGLERSIVSRYFERVPGGYRVKGDVRQRVVVARHDFTFETPFTQIDLLICRNALIYFQPHAQARALELFHFALRPEGFLFLGPSEGVGELTEEFSVVSGRWRIFRKQPAVPQEASSPAWSGLPGGEVFGHRAARDVTPSLGARQPLTETRVPFRRTKPARAGAGAVEVEQALLRQHLPPCVVVSRAFEIQHLYGGVERLLHLRGGEMSTNLLDMVEESVAATLSTTLRRAQEEQAAVVRSRAALPGESGDDGRVSVEPLELDGAAAPLFLVSFQPQRAQPIPSGEGGEETASGSLSLRAQLTEARADLQSAISDLELSNEQLHSTNDELVASNEQLQSTNEELQSVNEELHLVNAEHEKRIEQVSQERADMANLLSATGVGVIFVDRQLRVRRFTPSIEKSFRLVPEDVGRPLETFAHTFAIQDLNGQVARTMQQAAPFEAETTDGDGCPYLVRITPYIQDETATGAVITLVDISASRDLSRRLSHFEHIVNHSTDMHSLLDERGRFVFVNPAMARAHGRQASELVGEPVNLVDADWDLDRYQQLFREVHQSGAKLFLSRNQTADGESFPVEVNASPVTIDGEPLLFSHSRDVSSRARVARYGAFARRVAILAHEAEELSPFVDGLLPAAVEELGALRAGVLLLPYGSEISGGKWMAMPGQESFQPDEALLESGLRRSGVSWSPDIDLAEPGSSVFCAVSGGSKLGRRALLVLEFHFDELRATRGKTGLSSSFASLEPALEVAVRSLSLLLSRLDADSARRLRDRALNASFDGIAIADATQPGLPLVYVNHGFEVMTGYSSADALGRNCRFLQGAETDTGARAELSQAIRSEVPIRITLLNYRKNGETFWNDLQVSPVFDDDGKISEYVAVQHDITERIENERDLQVARQKAALASRAKSRFLATVSHEIRSPMTAIVGFVDAIGRRSTEPETLQSLAAIRRNADYLLRLIGDILDMSQIEAGKLEIAPERVDLPLLVRDVGELMSVRSDEKNLAFCTELETPIPRFGTTDPIRLRQILVNLLSNAIKFTEQGEVRLTARFDGDAARGLEFDVIDTGMGIPLEAKERIFKPFVRPHTDDDHQTHYDGAGLGLSIVKRLLSALGGKIEVESREGSGTRFRFSVPLELDETVEWCSTLEGLAREPAPASWRDDNEELLDSLRILVADDRADVAHVIQFYLEDAGAAVEVVHDGRQAVEAFTRARETPEAFHVIVLDMQMPVLDGYGAAEEIRAVDAGVPIIALTAGAARSEEMRALKAGCSVFLAKPAEEATLLRLVAKLGRGGHDATSPDSLA